VQYLPVKSVSFASQIRRGNYKNSNIAKIAGKFGRSFLAKLANFPRFLPELDIYLPKEQIAIEIQGRWHSEESVAERDRLKIEMCRAHGIGLLSIDWGKARTELLSQPLDEVLNQFRQMVEAVRTNGGGFIAY